MRVDAAGEHCGLSAFDPRRNLCGGNWSDMPCDFLHGYVQKICGINKFYCLQHFRGALGFTWKRLK